MNFIKNLIWLGLKNDDTSTLDMNINFDKLISDVNFLLIREIIKILEDERILSDNECIKRIVTLFESNDIEIANREDYLDAEIRKKEFI